MSHRVITKNVVGCWLPFKTREESQYVHWTLSARSGTWKISRKTKKQGVVNRFWNRQQSKSPTSAISNLCCSYLTALFACPPKLIGEQLQNSVSRNFVIAYHLTIPRLIDSFWLNGKESEALTWYSNLALIFRDCTERHSLFTRKSESRNTYHSWQREQNVETKICRLSTLRTYNFGRTMLLSYTHSYPVDFLACSRNWWSVIFCLPLIYQTFILLLLLSEAKHFWFLRCSRFRFSHHFS